MIKYPSMPKNKRTPEEIERDLLEAIKSATETQNRTLNQTYEDRRERERKRVAGVFE